MQTQAYTSVLQQKCIGLLLFILLGTSTTQAQLSNLIISEYGEGTGNNKYVEIYNGTGVAVNLANYQLWRISNGGNWPEATLNLSGTLANGDVYIVAHASADPTILGVADVTNSAFISFNGDDAVGLAESGTLIDAIGTNGADPGAGWDVAGIINGTANRTLVRKATICSPQTNWTTSAGTNATDSEWMVLAQNDWTNIHAHTESCAACTEPTTITSNITMMVTSASTIDLMWTNGDGINRIVVMRAGNPVSGLPSDASTYTANSAFGSGSDLGGGNFVVYNGNSTTTTVTGLTTGLTYHVAVFEYNCLPGSEDYLSTLTTNIANETVACPGAPTTTTSALTFPSIGTNSLNINWTNGDGANRIVVMREGAAVTATPTNNTTYTANGAFGSGTDLGTNEYVVYNGTGNTVTVTNLNPATTYHIAVYEYNCFPGLETYLPTISTNIGNETTLATPPPPTTLSLGDIVIIGVNANNNACSGNVAEDLISLVAFKDITPGTSIDITDNGWERANAGQFGDTEGAYNMVYSGSTTLLAGTVFTYVFPNSSVTAVVDAANPDWTVTKLAGSNTLNMNNGGDQIYLMQGGTWANGAGLHDATYTGGRFLFGFNTRSTWAADGTTQQSNLHPAVACSNILPTGGTTDFIHYSGPTTPVSAAVWFDRISNNTNWTSHTNCINYNSTFNLTSITINNTVNFVARWTGAVSTDWFDCQNWDVRRVPDMNIDAVVDQANSIRNCEIDRTSPLAANFGSVAVCNNLTINDEIVRIMSANDQLYVHGDLLIENGTSELDMDETTDGALFLYGNWTNQDDNAAFVRGDGTVHLIGTADQTITTSDPSGIENFANVVVNKTSGTVINNCTQMTIDDNMDFQNGIVHTTAVFELRFDVDATATNASNTSHVNGPAVKETSTSAATNFTFPIGKGGRLGQLGIETTTFDGERFAAEYFNTIHSDVNNYNATELDHVSQIEYWDLDDVLDLGTSARVTLHWGAHSNVVTMPSLRVAHYYTEAPNLSNQWESEGNTGTTGNITVGTVTSNVISTYSPFTLGDIVNQISLPLDLLAFDAKKVETAAQLDWMVADEEVHTTYIVERSIDGINFETRGEIEGTLSTHYGWLDIVPVTGTNYYRLRIIENGVTRYSTIRVIVFEPTTTGITVYPSPVRDLLTVELGTINKRSVTIEVYDVLGHLLISTQAATNKVVLNTDELALGTYILRVGTPTTTFKQIKFIKQ